MSELDTAPGLFGKVTSHGDFMSRRLPPAFIAIWDGWLQSSMQGSRDKLGPKWLDTYLTSPLWRFVLAPGVCDANSWAGVMMPSVDRVGRHFPLTLAVGVAGGPDLANWMVSNNDWFEQLEDLALSTLEANFAFDQFDAALQAMQGLDGVAGSGSYGPAGFHLPLTSLDQIAAAVPALTAAALHGQSIWWTDGSAQVAPCALMCRGLPTAQSFAGMLAGLAPGQGA